jgi:competence protein ComEC
MLKVIRSQLHTLFIPLLFWLAGIILATLYHYHWSLNLLVTISFLLMLFLPRARIYLILLAFFLLAFFHTSSYLQTKTNEIGFYLQENTSISEMFTYQVSQRKQTSTGKCYYIVKLQKLNNFPIQGNVLLFNAPDSLRLYSTFQTALAISSISQAHNPAEFDFSKYYKYQGIQGSASALGITKKIMSERSFWQRIKYGVITKIESVFKENKNLALALFLGDKGLLSIDQEQLSNLGLLHLFAVSGLHVGIIYGTILIILNLFIGKNWARLTASLVLILYGYLCAWSPSVFRTVLIISIYNLTLVFQRKISFLQLLSLTLFIITICNPLQLFSVGLHLSLTAFISLWLADRKFLPYIYKLRRKYNIKKYQFRIIQYLAYSLAVLIFITPLSLYYFNVMSFNALITNIVASPIVMLMLNIILLSLILPQAFIVQEYLYHAFAFLNAIFAKLIEEASFLPFFTRRFALNGIELLSLILVVSISIILFKRKKIVALSFVFISALIFTLILFGLLVNYQDQVICFAAGKADCSYLEFADGNNLLIDTGSQEQNPNIMKNSVISYLKKRHIRALDRVIITHPHEDHYGGLSLLAKHIKIKELIIHQTALNDKLFAKLINSLKSQIPIIVLHDTISFANSKIRILHPDSQYESANMNNNSLVTMVSYTNSKLLFTGDIEEEAEERLVRQYGKELKADFLKVPHHGSITSSTSNFIEMVNPCKCFIPAGISDRDKFPNPHVLERLKHINSEVYIGADSGALIMNIGQ